MSFLSFTRKKEVRLRALVATMDPAALAALGQVHAVLDRFEAFTTGGVYRQVKGANLIILDYAALAETDGLSREGLSDIIERSGATICTPLEFAANPADWEARSLAAMGAIEALPAKAIVFVSFSGGVGKTTSTLDLARSIAGKPTHLPAAAIEFKHGRSSFRALLNRDAPHLYEVLTQDVKPAVWEGVTLYPMEHQTAALLHGRDKELLAQLRAIKARHVLTIIDAEADSEFLPGALEMVDEVYAVTTPRADAMDNALAALQDIKTRLNGHSPRMGLILNQVRTIDRVALAGVERVLTLPYFDRFADYDGRLGRPLLSLVYPGWKA